MYLKAGRPGDAGQGTGSGVGGRERKLDNIPDEGSRGRALRRSWVR